VQLLKLQQQFKDILFQKEEGLSLPLTQGGARAKAQFFLYQNNLYSSLYKNLTDKFSMTRAWLGEEAFFAQAKEYIFTVPQHSPYLCDYGGTFPSILSDSVGKEIANLEWKMNLSLVSYRVETPLAVEDVLTMPPPTISRATFRLSSSIQVHTSSYALKEIWMSLKKGKKPPSYRQRSYFFISAKNQQSFFSALSESEYNFLTMIKEGKSLGEACDPLSDADFIQQLLHRFIPYFVEIGNKSF